MWDVASSKFGASVHTRIRTHTRARTRAHTQTHTHLRTHTRIYILSVCLYVCLSLSLTHTHIQLPIFTHNHTLTNRHTGASDLPLNRQDTLVSAIVGGSSFYILINECFSLGRLGDHCSLYTAELQAIRFALTQAYQSEDSKFIILSDSLCFSSAGKNTN